MSKANLPPKRRCRFSNSKTERELQYARREQSRRSSITFSRSASRRMKNSILQNSVESRRKSEKNSIVSGIGCGRTPNHDCAGGNLNLQIPSSNTQRRNSHPERSEGSLAFLLVSDQQSEMFRSAQNYTMSVPADKHRVC